MPIAMVLPIVEGTKRLFCNWLLPYLYWGVQFRFWWYCCMRTSDGFLHSACWRVIISFTSTALTSGFSKLWSLFWRIAAIHCVLCVSMTCLSSFLNAPPKPLSEWVVHNSINNSSFVCVDSFLLLYCLSYLVRCLMNITHPYSSISLMDVLLIVCLIYQPLARAVVSPSSLSQFFFLKSIP